MKKQKTKNKKQERGFTIIEMMVAVALFAVVMLVSAGALLSLATANRKAQALQSVMNNLNTTLDSMVRSMREGNTYHCGVGGVITAPVDCANGDTQIAFEPHGGNPATPDQRVYSFVAPSGTQGGYIQRSEDAGSTWVRVTAPEISIVDMQFYVVGTTPGDATQPKVVVKVKGTAGGSNAKITTAFHIQATAVQRVLDI